MATEATRDSTELHFERLKDGHTITVTIRLAGDDLTIEIGPDRNAPKRVFTCSKDQWLALRYAAEWYFDALDEAQSSS